MKTNTTTWCFLAWALWAPTAVVALPVCWADVTGDGVVGTPDLLYLLSAWGTADARVDFDGDGEVACFDLEFLIGNWGMCPDYDVNGDGSIDDLDIDFVEENLGLECSADLNLDGNIDEDDVDAILCRMGSPGPIGDLDHNGFVQSADLAILLAAFGSSCTCDLNQDSTVDTGDVEILTKGVGKRRSEVSRKLVFP